MNRQQFNKYLAGQAMPSRHNLRRICAFLGVEEAEIMLPSRRFAEVVDLRPRVWSGSGRLPPHIEHIKLLRRLGGNRLDAYLGYYYRYFYSYGFPGRIVKSLLAFYRQGNVYYTKNVGMLTDSKGDRPHAVHFRYLGLPLLLNDRIFLLEYESRLRDIVSETILYPTAIGWTCCSVCSAREPAGGPASRPPARWCSSSSAAASSCARRCAAAACSRPATARSRTPSWSNWTTTSDPRTTCSSFPGAEQRRRASPPASAASPTS
jgi:hypothetical protein